MEFRGYWLCLALFFLTACGATPATEPSAPEVPETPAIADAIQPGNYNKTIFTGGLDRSYILHVPTGYDGSQALPLVFVLHGQGGTAKGMMEWTSMNQKADQEGFFVAYLQGTNNADGVPAWNNGIQPENNITVDDSGFVRELATQLKGQLKLDSQRIYAAGFSSGSSMCHRLGAELPDVLAGVAAVESTIGTSQDEGATFTTIPAAKGTIPVLIIHGKSDNNVPYDGGQGGKLWTMSVADTVAFWTQADGCTGTPQVNTSSDGNIITEDYKSCAGGSEVELITILSGVHQWPTLENDAAFDGSEAIWEFFSRHSKN